MMAAATMSKELRDLLDSDIPTQISNLEESSVGLERVAAYCEANYSQSANKEQAFNDTKKLTLQSLASVAYYINSLSTAVLRSLDLEAENLAQKGNEIHNLKQLVTIQKEKMARREIGKLTINKSINRQNKITYPAVDEKTPRYHRTPIDYSILDGIGHGRRSSKNDYAPLSTHLISRTGSIVSGDSIPSNNSVGGSSLSNNPYEQYAVYTRGNDGGGSGTHTLTRQSVRSVNQYRVPQVIPSALQPTDNNNPYHMQRFSSAVAGPIQQQIYSGQQQYNSAGGMMADTGNYGTLGRGGVAGVYQSHMAPPNDSSYRLSSDSADGLPPPPFVQPQRQTGLAFPHHHPDDPLPPPPPMNTQQFGNYSNYNNGHGGVEEWIPPTYIEKARVVYAYDASRPDELTLTEDAIVFILRKNDDGWFEGVMDGTTGLFPGNYVTPIEN